MGKTKQTKEKKFDRNVEISSPILDPEVELQIQKQIHSPPKEQKLDIKHGGFKALLSDLNPQDSTDEVQPIMEKNHLPSYIGISCAVSGYSSYSAYTKHPLDNDSNSMRIESSLSSRLASSNKQTKDLSAPTRSQTNSPTASRLDAHHINHITIDRSQVSSADQERRELTQKLTASASERRRSPSPLGPTEDDRHHGAYVGARYCPMPPPSKLVHKHIPLLGIDDDQNPDDYIAEDVNKVEEKIATLYGDTFVEDWKESMSHKSKREHFEEEEQKKTEKTKSPKDLVHLRTTPAKSPEAVYGDADVGVIDVPTPNVKVLAGVEKKFLNKLLTDENPPMPKSPSPQTSPVFNAKIVKQEKIVAEQTKVNQAPSIQQKVEPIVESITTNMSSNISRQETAEYPVDSKPEPRKEDSHEARKNEIPEHLEEELKAEIPETTILTQRSPTPPSLASPDSQRYIETPSPVHEPVSPIPESAPSGLLGNQQESVDSYNDGDLTTGLNSRGQDVTGQEVSLPNQQQSQEIIDSFSPTHQDSLIDLANIEHEVPNELNLQGSPRPISPLSNESQKVSENIEASHESLVNPGVENIRYEIRADSPVDNQSSPIKDWENNESHLSNDIFEANKENLVSFSPEPLSGLVEDYSIDQTKTQQSGVGIENLVDLLGDQDGALQKIDSKLIMNPEPKIDSDLKDTETCETTKNIDGDLVDAGDNNNKDGHYYLKLLEQEESFINNQVKLAETRLAKQESVMDEDTLGRLRSAIGKANLLINKKCNQFRELCEKGINCDSNDQYAVLNDDLAGFWDMLTIQISDVRKSFESLK